jgi:hypothetical protein
MKPEQSIASLFNSQLQMDRNRNTRSVDKKQPRLGVRTTDLREPQRLKPMVYPLTKHLVPFYEQEIASLREKQSSTASPDFRRKTIKQQSSLLSELSQVQQ